MSVSTTSTSILSGRRLSLVRVGWLVLFVLYTMFTIYEIWDGLNHLDDTFWIYSTIYIAEDILSWVLAIILFRKKSSEWVVVLVTVMFLSGVSSYGFWLWFFRISLPGFIDPEMVANIINLPFEIFGSVIRLGVFLTFPLGKWISPAAKRLFWFSIPIFLTTKSFFTVVEIGFASIDNFSILTLFILSYWVYNSDFWTTIIYIFLSSIWVLAGYMLFTYYRNMQDSLQRQQIKWIVIFFFMSVCASALLTLFNIPNLFSDSLNQQLGMSEFYKNIFPWLVLPSSLLRLGLVVAFSLSIFRYRLWDVDVFINKTLVYSGLTALLGGLILVSTTLVNYGIKQWFGEDESSIWAVLISAIPVATAFNPLRERLQKWVDQYFKPEEVDFANTFIEFKPEVQELLTTQRITQILSEQVKKQLNVDFTRTYLLKADKNLQLVGPSRVSKEHKKLVLEEKLLTQLRNGKVVVDDDGIPYSLLVPLVVPRARIPDFFGVIVLGRRLNGKGYPTQILNNLQALGAEAGKAIYLSQLSEKSKRRKR